MTNHNLHQEGEPDFVRPNPDQRAKADLLITDPEIKHLATLTDEERTLALEGRVDEADEATQIWTLFGSLDAYDWHLLNLGSKDDADPGVVDAAERNLALWIARFEDNLDS
jgi:hypothetical protein